MDILFFVLIVTAGAFLFLLCMRESQRNIEARVGFSPQPEISDAEFCQSIPDVAPDTALKVREICSDATGWEREEIHPNTKLVEFELW